MAQVKVIELTLDDVGYNGVTKRDVGKLLLVWQNGCTDIVSKYESLPRYWIGRVIVENGGAYSRFRKDDNGDFVFHCIELPKNACELFPQAIVKPQAYRDSQIVFPKNVRLKTLRTTYKGVTLYA